MLASRHRFFKRVMFFIVREPWVLGWSGVGEGIDRALAAALRIPLDQPSVFQTVVRGKTLFVGRLGPEEENHRFLKALGKRPATNAALFPVAVRGRVVNLIYGDNGARGSGQARPRRADRAHAENPSRLPADHPQAHRGNPEERRRVQAGLTKEKKDDRESQGDPAPPEAQGRRKKAKKRAAIAAAKKPAKK